MLLLEMAVRQQSPSDKTRKTESKRSLSWSSLAAALLNKQPWHVQRNLSLTNNRMKVMAETCETAQRLLAALVQTAGDMFHEAASAHGCQTGRMPPQGTQARLARERPCNVTNSIEKQCH